MKLPTLRFTLSDRDFELAKPALLLLRSSLRNYAAHGITARLMWQATVVRGRDCCPTRNRGSVGHMPITC